MLVPLPATNAIAKFWNAVCSGQVDCKDSILSFKEAGLSWMIGDNIPMICERNAYKEIFEELRVGNLKKMLVLGSPGIGKSLLEFYLMYRFACEWKDGATHSILYKTGTQVNPHRYLLETNGTQHQVFLVIELNVAISPDYYFTDTYSDMDYIPTKTTVHVASPSDHYYDQFSKSVDTLATRKMGTIRYMLPFTWEEARCLWNILNLLVIKHNLSEISEEEFELMFCVFGGSARLLSSRCTVAAHKIKEFVDKEMTDFFDGVAVNMRRRHLSLKEAYPETWANICSLIAKNLQFMNRSNALVVKQLMFSHIYPDQDESWASSFMKYLAGAIMEDRNYYVCKKDCGLFNSNTAAMGAIFERGAIKAILANLKEGQSYMCYKLKKSKNENSESWKLKCNRVTRKVIINKLEDIGNMQRGQFGVPNIVNFSPVDLVYKGDHGELIFFHMYYGNGNKHKGAVDRLNERLNDFRRSNNGPHAADKMIFVLKPENKSFVYRTELASIDQFRMDFQLSRIGELDDIVEEVDVDLNTDSVSPQRKKRKVDETNTVNNRNAK